MGSADDRASAPPALVVLAAGASRRLGRCKALVEIAGRSPLERLLAESAGVATDPLVVTGRHHDRIAAAVARLGLAVEIARNEEWASGRTGSVRRASRARPGRDLCIAPVDVPLVPRSVFEALADAWERAGRPARGWLGPSHRETPGATPRAGHPIVLGRELAAELGRADSGVPLRRLRANANPCWLVEVAEAAVLDDLDEPADLAALEARTRGL